mmetsp:Transcript_31412/g.81625  ORF Transcript_31412/g.81625 Transcript_31412/m.81625 type:complete len:226 (-) Transcript_31412:546-1223(-)
MLRQAAHEAPVRDLATMPDCRLHTSVHLKGLSIPQEQRISNLAQQVVHRRHINLADLARPQVGETVRSNQDIENAPAACRRCEQLGRGRQKHSACGIGDWHLLRCKQLQLAAQPPVFTLPRILRNLLQVIPWHHEDHRNNAPCSPRARPPGRCHVLVHQGRQPPHTLAEDLQHALARQETHVPNASLVAARLACHHRHSYTPLRQPLNSPRHHGLYEALGKSTGD